MSAAELRQAAHTLRDGRVNRCTAEIGSALADLLDEAAEDVELGHLFIAHSIARAINDGAS